MPQTQYRKPRAAKKLATPTPATDGRRVVSYFGSFGLVCHDLSEKELWRHPLPLALSLGTFSRFLQLAALEAGNISHFRGIARKLGVPHRAVAGYYEIFEDCLIAERAEPVSESRTRKKLTKSPRYLFFDLGVRRPAADEGPRLSARLLRMLFEQLIPTPVQRVA